MARIKRAEDDFERADGPVGANWAYIRNTAWNGNTPIIKSGASYGLATAANYQIIRWVGPGTIADNQYSRAFFTNIAYQSDAERGGVAVSIGSGKDTLANYYALYTNLMAAGAKPAKLIRVENGAESTLWTGTIAIAEGSSLTLEREGAVLKAYHNGTLVNTSTDPTPLAAGKPGLMQAGSSSTTFLGVTNWEGGDMADVPATKVNWVGPTTGLVNVDSDNFNLSLDGAIDTDVIVTPAVVGGGVFTPTTVTLTKAVPTGSFKYKAASAGSKTISMTNNGGLDNPANITFTATNTDAIPPVITGPGGATGSTSSKSQVEGLTSVHTFTADEPVTWSLNGGADIAKFDITPSTGALFFRTAPSFDAPGDVGADNTYIVGVRAIDASSNATTQTLTVTITKAPVVVEAGFDLHSNPKLVFGDMSGVFSELTREAGVAMVLYVYTIATGALLVTSGTLTTNSQGKLARWTHASLVSGTKYRLDFVRSSDKEPCTCNMTAT